MTLVSVTAYHSFGGEVEASNTPTIRRLTPSCRHQLPHIAQLPPAAIIADAEKFISPGVNRILVKASYGNEVVAQPPWSESWPSLGAVMKVAISIDGAR